MKFTMTIDSENQDVVDHPVSALRRSLTHVSEAVQHGIDARGDSGRLHDINGNSIGRWEVSL